MLPLALDSQVRAPEYSQICKRRWGYKDPKVCPSEDAAAEEGGRRQDHRRGAEEAGSRKDEPARPVSQPAGEEPQGEPEEQVTSRQVRCEWE